MEILPASQEPLDDLSDLSPIPQYFRARSGQIIDSNADVWCFQPSRERGHKSSINWKRLEYSEKIRLQSNRYRHLIKLYFIDSATGKASITVSRYYGILIAFYCWLRDYAVSSSSTFPLPSFNWIDLDERTMRAFIDFREKHIASPEHSLYFLRNLYTWGVARHYPDFSPNMLRLLKTTKVRTFPKGQNVRFRHPTKGPFSADEVLLIRDAIKEGRGTDQSRALVMLHLELGLNPYATAQLMNKDLKRYDVKDESYYQIDIPRIKKKIIHRETKRRPISNQLGYLLEKLQQGGPEDPLFHWLSQSWTCKSLSDTLRCFVRDADIKSLHTNLLLHVNPRRFRYTLATHMAEEGASKYHIAEILDHSDLQSVDVYTQTVSSISAPVARATDSKLGPVVSRFLGKIIGSAEQQTSEGESNAIIPAMVPYLPIATLNLGGVGMCGRDVRKDGLCRLFPPMSCYLCPHFAALRDGPHQEMLESIETFIGEIQDSVDNRIWKQLDTIRDAVKEVIEQLRSVPSIEARTLE